MSFSSWDMRTDHVHMKILTHISRFLLAVIFTVFGLNGFLHFIPMPPPSGVAGQFMGAMFVTKYLLFVFAIQLIAGVLLFIKRYVPLALTLLAPVIVNILLSQSHGSERPRARTVCRDLVGNRVCKRSFGVRRNC
jgi:putative oxidoreductase